MNSSISPSPQNNLWVKDLNGSDNFLYSDSSKDTAKMGYADSGLSGVNCDDIMTTVPPPSGVDIGERIMYMQYYRTIKYSGDEIVDIIPAPEVKIRCKRQGLYTLVVGKYTQDKALHYNNKFFLNGSEINPTNEYESSGWYYYQYLYQLSLKPGDIFSIRWYGGTFNDFYDNPHTWEDNTMCFYRSKNGGGASAYYSLAVTAIGYRFSDGGNKNMVITPVNVYKEFEAYT